MKFRIRPQQKLISRVKGIFASPIQYEVRVPTGDWTLYLCPFEQQSFGRFDTDSCWMLSACNSFSMQMKYLWLTGAFGTEAQSFFLSNGYCDQGGNFSLSERLHEILCGNLLNGGTSPEAWQSFQKRGHIPRTQLEYTTARAALYTTEAEFIADYFNKADVTPAMLALGQQFLEYVNIAYQRIGLEYTTPNMEILQAALKQAPLNLGIPVPQNVSMWNQTFIQYDGSTVAAHEVTDYVITPTGYGVEDQYQPAEKVLSLNYYLPGVMQGLVTAIAPAPVAAIPQLQGELNDSFFTRLMNWFNGIMSPFPIG